MRKCHAMSCQVSKDINILHLPQQRLLCHHSTMFCTIQGVTSIDIVLKVEWLFYVKKTAQSDQVPSRLPVKSRIDAFFQGNCTLQHVCEKISGVTVEIEIVILTSLNWSKSAVRKSRLLVLSCNASEVLSESVVRKWINYWTCLNWSLIYDQKPLSFQQPPLGSRFHRRMYENWGNNFATSQAWDVSIVLRHFLQILQVDLKQHRSHWFHVFQLMDFAVFHKNSFGTQMVHLCGWVGTFSDICKLH